VSTTGSPNILLIIADDLGQDVVNVTGTGATKAMQVETNDGTTAIIGDLPNLSTILRNGVYFQQAWAQPACSPTRAALLTGLHPWKSGVGSPMGSPELDPLRSYTTLPELLPSGYASGLFGKWHLGANEPGTRPTDHGWDRHYGTVPEGAVPDYEDWTAYDSDDYDNPQAMTTDATWNTVREAAEWINGLDAADPDTPWFATVAFHAPHSPFYVPDVGYDLATPGDVTTDAYQYNVMTQSVDHHIGRLLGADAGGVGWWLDFDPIPQAQLENTLVIFLGDNGSPVQVASQEPKTLVYEYGVRVPMIVADGQAIAAELNGLPIATRLLHSARRGLTSPTLAHAVDLYATIALTADPDATGLPADTDSRDLRSFVTGPLWIGPLPAKGRLRPPLPGPFGFPPIRLPVPARHFNFAQWYHDADQRATIRNLTYKLNYDAGASPEYSLYRYIDGEIPGIEVPAEVVDPATDIFAEALNGLDVEAGENLGALLDELIANYQPNLTATFPDPR
jgi:hypothetical protein